MKILIRFICTGLLLLCAQARAVEVVINTGTTYQTIRGWGWVNSLPSYITPEFQAELIYEIVDQYGLNRIRFEIPAGNRFNKRRWEWSNDDADPENTAWQNFDLTTLDKNVEEITGPFAQHVKDRGDPFDMYISYSYYTGGSSGSPPAWILHNPGEYTEFAMSLLLRLKYLHGLESDYICILNEPQYNNVFTLATIRDKIEVLGPTMAAAGLKTKIQYPESLNIDNGMNNFITPTASDDDLWSWIGNVSYHRYGGQTQMADMATFAANKNLPTAMTEHSHLTIDRMYEDLTVANVSYWEVYGIGSEIVLYDNPENYNFLERQNWWWRFRQIMQFVRPGAVRVDVSSDDSQLRTLGFVKDGQTVLILLNDKDSTTRTINISGLSTGTYGLSGSRLTAATIERGLQTVGADGKLTLTLPGSTVYTLYPHPGGNAPPYFTNFRPSVGYLVLPDSSFDLIAAAQDPDLDSLSFQWTLTKQPAGASVVLAAAQSATCSVSGLSIAGNYAFDVEVTDGVNVVSREVRMEVFAGNPAPVISDLHNRIPVRVTLPDSSTNLRSGAWNVDGDTLSYQWSIVSQPIGAAATFETPTDERTIVNGLTVAGDYIFRITVDDGTTAVSAEHTVPVYPLNNTPTVSGSASPNTLTLPTAQTTLNATCSDPDGDPLSHWWRLVSAPAGARPLIVSPASEETVVKGLILPGDYIFKHIATDESEAGFSNNITVTVSAGSAPEILFLSSPDGGETFVPNQTINLKWTSANFSGDVRLEFFDGSNWSDIAASTANDGIESWTLPSTVHEDCKIRVSDVVDGDPMDASDSPFRIYSPVPISEIEMSAASGSPVMLEWPSLPGGYEYQLYYTDSLSPINWQPLGGKTPVGGLQFEMMQNDTASGIPMRFYRVEENFIQSP